MHFTSRLKLTNAYNVQMKISLSKRCQSSGLSRNLARLSYHSVTALNRDHSLSPIFIFHGLFGNKNNWKSMSRALAAKTLRTVYAFDLRNHGLTGRAAVDGHNTLTAMADDICLFMDENGIDKACLVGHSLGGRVVAQLAFNSPDRVDKLVSVDMSPNGSIPKDAFFSRSNFIDVLSNAVQRLPPNLNLSEARKLVDTRLKDDISDAFIRGFFLMSLDKDENEAIIWRYHLDGIRDMLENNYINRINIAQPFRGKALIIHGQNSDYVKKSDYNSILEVLPNANFVAIPEAGHYLHIEKPNEVIDSLVSFINS